MFNSPASRLTPRRNPGKPRESLAPTSRAQSVFSENLAAPTPRSRLAVSRVPASPTSTIAETLRTVREVDGFERVTWSKDARHEVYSAGGLPKEVQKLLKASDFVDDIVAGHIDPISGFAFVATPRECIAWNYQKRTHSSPTCYHFPAPEPQYGLGRLPALASFFSSTNAAEPGIIIVGPTGEVRVWESMSLALSSSNRFQTLHIELAEGDRADRIFRLDGQNFIITTASCFAHRITVTASAGRVVPHQQQLMRSGGFLGRANPIIFPRSTDQDRIAGVALSDSAMFMLSGNTLQKWSMAGDGQKLVQEYDLYDIFVKEFFEDDEAVSHLVLRDLVPCGPDKLAVLVAYSQPQSSSSQSSNNLSHAIYIFSIGSNNVLQTHRISLVQHNSPADNRLLDTPRLYIPASTPTAFVRFETAVAFVSLETDHVEIIQLRDTNKNAFIGVGCVVTPTSTRRTAGPALLLMPVTGGLLSVDVFDTSAAPEEQSPTDLVKSKIEQHVFFGDRSDNPLSFGVSRAQIAGADVEAAAEAVSADVLSSKSPYQPALFETKALLADRLARLREIMAYVRANGLMDRIGQAGRRRLSRDAEKAKGAIDLWDHQDHQMANLLSGTSDSLLADSIDAYMRQTGSAAAEDVVRSFFRSQVAHLDRLLDVVFTRFTAKTDGLSQNDICPWVKEANTIFNVVTRAASRFREAEIGIYEITRQRPTVGLWTSKESIMQAMETLYEITERTIKDRTKMLGSTIDDVAAEARDQALTKQRRDQNVLKTQLSDLAAALCLNMEDKIRLHSQREMNGGADANEGINLKQRWDQLRPRIIRPLVTVDRVDQAYALAEHHNDFETLVWLCHEPASQRGQEQVQHYIELFQEEFAFVLYQYYIDQGQLHALMTQDEVYGQLLTKFFEINDYPHLAWMHHIACKRYGAAATTLTAVNKRGSALDEKHLVSSIGKLAAVAEIKSKGDTGSLKRILNDIDDDLELVGIQNDLRAHLVSTGKKGLHAYVAANGHILADRHALRAVFEDIAGRLLAGDALDLEDLVDVLTLKDNKGVSVNDPVIALDRLVRDTTLPEGRKQVALVSVWRRVFIRDDWAHVSSTAGRSDEIQREVLRNTLTYRTLKSITNDARFPQSFIISPYDASTPPYESELSARFPDWPAEKIQALMADHESEIAQLTTYIDQAGLENMVRECAELIRRDEGAEANGGDEDVDM